jgi:hypothetical protein
MPCDPRIWTPDRSCEPWAFEANVDAADLLMGRFTIPQQCVAVIASVSTQCGTAIRKSTHRIVILQGRGDPADFVARTLSTHGALGSVEELDGTVAGLTGNNAPGFVVTTGALQRPVRVMLPAGDYEVVKTATTGGLTAVCFFGWLWRVPS